MASLPDFDADMTTLFRLGMAGDQAYYAEFLAQAALWARRALRGRLQSSDVEDVVQEMLISIHKARHTYDGERPLKPWMRAILSYRLADHLRKYYASSRHTNVNLDDILDTLADVTEDPLGTEYVNALLQSVPIRQQNILKLMHVQGFTAKEIGGQLGMKESAVKVAAHRAMKHIRNIAKP